jgi:hypothetical protein
MGELNATTPITDPKAERLAIAPPETLWGLVGRAPETARAVWGARAIQERGVPGEPARRSKGIKVDGRVVARGRIIKPARPAVPPTFDLLWDRQCMIGDEDERQRLGEALNGPKGLAKARIAYAAAVKRGELDPHEAGLVELVRFESGNRLVIVADTRGSCGYVYLGAWFDPPAHVCGPREFKVTP